MSSLLDTTFNPDADGLVGGFTLWGSDNLPTSKHMFAEGQAISRTLYSLLFSRLGTLHGVGDGSTTFNLPDLVDVVVRGGDGGDTGDTGGTATATMPAHTHDQGSLALSLNGALTAGSGIAAGANLATTTNAISGNTGSAGGTGDNWPPYIVMRWIVKVL